MTTPTIEEIQAQQQATKIMEAQNALPHLNAVLPVIDAQAVKDLAALCGERFPLIADPAARQELFNVYNVLTLAVGNITRMRDAAALLVPTAG